MDNLFAYTAHAGTYPEYASLNEGEDGKLQLTVRAPASYPGGSFHAHPGAQATIELPPEQLQALALGALRWLAERCHVCAQATYDPAARCPLWPSMPAVLAAGCCSSSRPCGHQKASPDTICGVCAQATGK